MTRSLVAYASRHGSTEEVAVSIAQQLHATGHRVELLPASRVTSVRGYDAVVLGGSLYAGRWHREARRFVKQHHRELAQRPFAIFALGPRTSDPADLAASRRQLDAELARLPAVAPTLVTVFGGAVDPMKLHFPFSRLPGSDARDWNVVAAWAAAVARASVVARREAPVIWGLQPRRADVG